MVGEVALPAPVDCIDLRESTAEPTGIDLLDSLFSDNPRLHALNLGIALLKSVEAVEHPDDDNFEVLGQPPIAFAESVIQRLRDRPDDKAYQILFDGIDRQVKQKGRGAMGLPEMLERFVGSHLDEEPLGHEVGDSDKFESGIFNYFCLKYQKRFSDISPDKKPVHLTGQLRARLHHEATYRRLISAEEPEIVSLAR